MFSKALTTVLLTGFVAGLFVTGAQMLKVTPLIIQAESYEISENSGAAHEHSGSAHEHSTQAWAPEDGAERTFYTTVSNIITGIAFSLLLVAVYLLRGKPVDLNSGLLWGLAGFVVFSAAPALGLPPELPGMTAAALKFRQAWWIGAVIATAVGIALLTETRTVLPKILAVALFAAPHVVGAPHPHVLESNVPAELSAQFAIASLVTSAFFWMVLGGVSGYFYRKLGLSVNTAETAPA